MIKQRSKFLTVVCACLPGAGHMLNGFMKRGFSFMAAFFGLIALSWFVYNPDTLVLPLVAQVWFYSFFDCINKTFVSEEEFYLQEDEYAFCAEEFKSLHFFESRRWRLIVGVALILIGVYAIWNGLICEFLYQHVRNEMVYEVIYGINRRLPKLAFSILIIWGGCYLIRGRKKDLDEEEEYETDGEE